MYLERSISWEIVRIFGNSNVVKSNYIWLFIIPFLAKNFDEISNYLNLDMEIAFSIPRLFFASLCFVFGTLVYQLRCPKLVKDHDGYASFEEKGKTIQHVVDYFQAVQRQPFPAFGFDHVKEFILKFDLNAEKDSKLLVSISNTKGEVESLFVDKILVKQFFWDTYEKLKRSNIGAALVSFIAYFIGCCFLFIISIENIIYALKLFLF
tara:strand:+ start:10068 stop:10691 length:624 start_codon:yes stop_codon:yes gene_type:complete